MKALKTLRDAILFFSDPIQTREYLVANRWPDGVICPRCGSKDVLFLEKYNRWHCRAKHDAPQFTLKTGTVMEDSPIGLEKWMPAFWLLANAKNGISSYELHRALGVTQKTAWFILHRIRVAMDAENSDKMGGNGPIEVDETFVGPNPRKMHANKRDARYKALSARPNVPVMGMLDREARQVRAKVVPNVRRDTLQNEILNQIEKGAKVYTDSAPAYDLLKAQDYIHEQVNHMKEYVRGTVHTQGIENSGHCSSGPCAALTLRLSRSTLTPM
jgi:transposase-like protein